MANLFRLGKWQRKGPSSKARMGKRRLPMSPVCGLVLGPLHHPSSFLTLLLSPSGCILTIEKKSQQSC